MRKHPDQHWAWDDGTDAARRPDAGLHAHSSYKRPDSSDTLQLETDREPVYSDRNYSSSDDSPIMSFRYDKYKHLTPHLPPHRLDARGRRVSCTTLAKFLLFCAGMILFCVVMYIPVYSKVQQIPKGIVAGWSYHKNRDTKIYVQPYKVTTVHQPRDISCGKNDKPLFLLVIVCSSTTNFQRRKAIRETWANYDTYLKMSHLFAKTKEKYKNYNFTYDLYKFPKYDNVKINKSVSRVGNKVKRGISYGSLLPKLAEALKRNIERSKTETEVPEVEEKRFDDDNDDDDDEDSEAALPQFDMDKELGEENDENNDYEYGESNVMKIPPNGYEESPSLGKILSILKIKKFITQQDKVLDDSNPVTQVERGLNNLVEGERMFKVMFLLGLPNEGNSTLVQGKIDEEIEEYGDILQENFMDSYNNLTLKSIMMLKWVLNNCKSNVHYILKTDDDMFINMPNLISSLKNKSAEFESQRKSDKDKEYLLLGHMIFGARPVSDTHNKWYSPAYMYRGKVYPRYLSGTGYVLSLPAAQALYDATLRIPYFHLEDVFITGLCALGARPRLQARHDSRFSYQTRAGRGPDTCAEYGRVSSHRVPRPAMAELLRDLTDPRLLDQCERYTLTKKRHEMAKGKRKVKPWTKPH